MKNQKGCPHRLFLSFAIQIQFFNYVGLRVRLNCFTWKLRCEKGCRFLIVNITLLFEIYYTKYVGAWLFIIIGLRFLGGTNCISFIFSPTTFNNIYEILGFHMIVHSRLFMENMLCRSYLVYDFSKIDYLELSYRTKFTISVCELSIPNKLYKNIWIYVVYHAWL